MLSRRNIRVKVMKALYALNRDETLTPEMAKKQYHKSLEDSYDTYLFNLYQLIKITEYANKDAAIRAAKLLPSEADKNFSTKIFSNSLTQSIATHTGFNELIKKKKIRYKVDADLTRKYYQEFSKTPNYTTYLDKEETTAKDHSKVLLDLFKLCIKDETYTEMVEDLYASWVDDESLIIGAIKKTIKALPLDNEFYNEYLPDEEATIDYGLDLLHKAIFFDEDLLEIITPVLKNWEADRVAVIDMILLKMALCELIHFPSIPTKVTINEYVEVAKMYSTPKSKDFINGVIDRLTKQLKKDGKIKKSGRGLIDE